MEATGSSQKDNEDFEEGHMVAVKLPDNPAPFIIAERCEMIKSDDEVEASVSDNTAVDVWWYGILKNHGEIERRVCMHLGLWILEQSQNKWNCGWKAMSL